MEHSQNSLLCREFGKLNIESHISHHHAHLEAQELSSMYEVMHNFFGEMISRGRNAQRENLLHYICRQNQYNLIESLFVQGCRLDEQDLQGRTPVHVAIERGHHECLLTFVEILRNYSSYNKDLQNGLRRTFQVYNNRGHTILHEAVLKNLKHVVREMLTFCSNIDITLAQNLVLGNGDSLLHLAVRENLLGMAEIVCDLFPELVNCSNYADILPLDIPSSITQGMNQLLTKIYRSEKMKTKRTRKIQSAVYNVKHNKR